MGAQIVGVLFIFSWTFVVTGAFFATINALGWFRLDPLEEEVGMDLSRHKGAAYDLTAAKAEAIEKLNATRHTWIDDYSHRSNNRKLVHDITDKHGSDELKQTTSIDC